ncbi:MAG: hypothetical protein WCZ66_09115 [Sphingomonadaceae bacterium]
MMRNLVVEEARRWIGTPFRHQGAVHGAGADCAGLVLGVARALMLTDYKPAPCSRQPATDELERHLYLAGCTGIPLHMGRAGDVAQFTIPGGLGHIGIFTGASVIHAWHAAGAVVEMPLTGA